MLNQKLKAALAQLNRIILGQENIIRDAMACLLARGHVLLEDLPGSGKTTLAKAFAATLGLDYRRIQCTADLLPADVIGFSVLQEGRLQFHSGPIFTQLLLADEINRASPKSQSALLEAMEERQITVDNQSYPLPQPFFVIATQNPQEQIGTFALPEAQLDRFMLRLSLGYPNAEVEVALLRGEARTHLLQQAEALLSRDDVLQLQNEVQKIHVSEQLAQYVQALLTATREAEQFKHGLSTRSGLALIRVAQALAFLEGEDAVLPQHIQHLFPAVAWHRLQGQYRSPEAHRHALQSILHAVPVPI